MKLRTLSLAVSVACTSLAAPSANAAFFITDLGAGLNAAGINDFGQVVGFNSGTASAYLWTPSAANGNSGAFTNLGTLPNTLGYNEYTATAINNQGQVVGGALNTTTGFGAAWVWNPTGANTTSGSLTAINGLPANTKAGFASDINASGQATILVLDNTAASIQHGYVWTPSTPNGNSGTAVDLGDLAPSTNATNNRSSALGINDSGVAVGDSTAGNNAQGTAPQDNAIRWGVGTTCTGATPTCTNLGDLAGGTIGGTLTDINNLGNAVGSGEVAGSLLHAMYVPASATSSSGLVDLGVLNGFQQSSAQAISESGLVVGASWNSEITDSDARATLWTQSGNVWSATDLNTQLAADDPLRLLGWVLTFANGINANGDIVASALDPNGVRHAVLLTQLASAPVPIPAAVWLLGSALVGLGTMRRRRT